MANQDIKRKFELLGDSSGAVKAVTDFVEHVGKAETALKDATKEGRQLGSALEDAIKSNRLYELSKSADVRRAALAKMRAELVRVGATDDEIKKVALSIHRNFRNGIQDATEDVRKLNTEIKEVGSADFGRESIGDVSTFGSSVASVLGAGGQNVGSELFAFGGDFAGVLEYTGKFKDAVVTAGNAAFENEGAFTKLSTTIFTAIPGISGTAAGLTAMALAAAPFVAAGAAVVGAILLVTSAYEEQKRIAQEAAEASLQGLDAETKARFLAQRARFDELKELQAAEEEAAALASATYVAQYEELQRLSKSTVGELVKEFGGMAYATAEIDRLKTAVKESGAASDQARAKYEGVKAVTEEYSDQIQRHTEFTERQTSATGEAGKAEEDLAKAREDHAKAIEQLNAQEEQAFADYLKRQRETSASRVTADNREREDRNRALERQQADLDAELAKQAEAFEAQQTAIAERGAAAILAIRDDLAKREADALTKIADLRAKAAEEDQKALLKYQKERARAEEDFRRNQDRARESYEQSQLDAILNNDVAAFLSNRTSFRTDRRRNREDFRTEGGRAFEDFEEERAARQAALEARIAEINTELEAYRAAQLAKIAEIEIQTAKELELNQLAYEEKLRLDADARKITNEREAEDLRIRAERRSADRILEDQKASEALTSTLAKIDTQRIAQNAALDAAIVKAQQFKAVIDSIAFSGGGGVYTGSGGSQLGKITPFASGVDYLPTNMRIDAHAGERILSRAQNATFTSYMQRAMGGGGGMGQRPIVQLNVQSTNIAGVEYVTITEMNRVVNSAIDELATDWRTAASVPV